MTGLKVGVEARLDAWIRGGAASRDGFGFYLNFVVFWIIVVGAHWFLVQVRYRERVLRAEALERQLAQAQLQSLEDRLKPHFLFNALNAISSLMHEDVDAADRAIERLGDLLRRALDRSSGQTVTLLEELEFARAYLDLEQLRLQERLTVDWDVEPGLGSQAVPALILQPLIENAVRHGLVPRASGGTLRVGVAARQGILELWVEDDGVGLAAMKDGEREGVGLGSTRARLALLYNGRAALRLEARPGRGTITRVSLPLSMHHQSPENTPT